MIIVKFLFVCLFGHSEVLAGTKRNWWTHSTIYKIFIWSFKDSDGDGIGDLKGITSMLHHFTDLGVDTLWITPFFKSPLLEAGYDITDFCDVDPTFGTMADFDELIRETKKRDIKIILDFVINHSSDEHDWFVKSVNKIDPYTNYYVWADPKGYDNEGKPIPPNNWISIFSGSAWKWNDKRKQFYYHQFVDRQPDLNLRNKAVREELKNVFRFWFEKGVAGARLDATIHYIEDELLRDEPPANPKANKTAHFWMDLIHIYTTNLWESYELIHEIREYVDEKFNPIYNEKIFVAEAYADTNHSRLYYGTEDYKIVQFPFNMNFVELQNVPSPTEYDALITRWLNNMPAHGVANWVMENHDRPRMGSRLSVEFSDIMLMTIFMLPGVACTYYGQEIGMLNYKLRHDQIFDPNGDFNTDTGNVPSDPYRLLMQWDDSLNAGFSSNAKTWLPVNPNYWHVNVEAQKNDPKSRYNLFKRLSKLRQTKVLKNGDFKSYIVSRWVYAFSRNLLNERSLIMIMNLGTETEFVCLHSSIPNLPPSVKVVEASLNSRYQRGKRLRSSSKFPQILVMRPLSAIIVST